MPSSDGPSWAWCDRCGVYHGENVPCDEGCIECGDFYPRGADGICVRCRAWMRECEAEAEDEMQRRVDAHEKALATEAYDHMFEGHGE